VSRAGRSQAVTAASAPSLALAAAPEVAEYICRRVAVILDAEQVVRLLPPSPVRRGRIEALVPAGASLADAHAAWRPGYLATLPAVGPLATQPPDALAPPGLVRVVFECEVEPSGGMSSHFGFAGWFVSLLVSVPLGSVWDSRVEEAR
jgi:hypothetical protein